MKLKIHEHNYNNNKVVSKKYKIIFWTAIIIIALWEGLMPISTWLLAPEYMAFETKTLLYPNYFVYPQKNKICNKELEFINNKIEYSILRISCQGNDGVQHTVVGEKIFVNLSEKQIEILNKLTCQQWNDLLNNKKTDWGTHIILYYLSGKSAPPYFDGKIGKSEIWYNIFKSKDVNMWKEIICNPIREQWKIPTCEDYLKFEKPSFIHDQDFNYEKQ